MPKVSQAGWLLGLMLFAGCTSHSREQPADRERGAPEAALEAAASPPLEPPPAVEPVTIGPRTLLAHKPFAGALGELTNDGLADVLALCHGVETPVLVLMRGLSDGTFAEGEPRAVEASGVALGDFDGDGDLDALLLDASSKPRLRVARNDGTGNFTIGPAQRIPGKFGGELHTAAIADLDGDGKLDAVVPLWDSLRVLPGDGEGGFGSGKALAIGRDPYDVAIADLDGDGALDLVATSQAGPARDNDGYDSSGAAAWIYRGSARGFAEPVRVGIVGAKRVELGDLDRDGRPEVVVSDATGLTVIHDALGELGTTRIAVASDGPLAIAEVLNPPGPDLLTPSYMQSRLHVLAGYPDPHKTSLDLGNFVVALFAASSTPASPRASVVLLNAGPPGGALGPPESSIDLLWVADRNRDCAGCERDANPRGR